MIGQTMGDKYKIVRLLGEGGMGEVYEGEQLLGTTRRKVAIKTLHPHLSRDPKIKARFEREVGTIAELEHPHTIQVYDFGSSGDGILYIVMEFLQGRSLADLLEKEGALAPDRALHILQQIAGSLEEAHGRGIVHRDLKPDNVVLVERAGQKDFVKVLDFGIAKRSREEDKEEQKLTQQGTVVGTPPYMSPEQFTGKPIDARSDIYSLGVMSYEMLTGKLPFTASTAWEWATQHMTRPPIPIESLAEGARVPAAMRGAIARALAKAPGDRFQTVHDFIEAFAGVAPASAEPARAEAPRGAKTEIGAPLDVAAAFGGGSSVPAPASQGASSPSKPTPTSAGAASQGAVAIPQAPRRGADGSSQGRTRLLLVAGVVGVASMAAIAFAVRGSGGTHAPAQLIDSASSAPPQAILSGDPAPTGSGTPSGATEPAGDIPPLSGATGNGGKHVGPVHPPHNGGPNPPPQGSSPEPGPTANPTPTPPKPRYDGPECQTARRLKALGHSKEAESWALACIAKGGNPG